MIKWFVLVGLLALAVLFIYGVGEVLILIDEFIYKKEKEKHKNENID